MNKTDNKTEEIVNKLTITNRISELKAKSELIGKEVKQANQFIQQKMIEANMISGALVELEKLISPE